MRRLAQANSVTKHRFRVNDVPSFVPSTPKTALCSAGIGPPHCGKLMSRPTPGSFHASGTAVACERPARPRFWDAAGAADSAIVTDATAATKTKTRHCTAHLDARRMTRPATTHHERRHQPHQSRKTYCVTADTESGHIA